MELDKEHDFEKVINVTKYDPRFSTPNTKKTSRQQKLRDALVNLTKEHENSSEIRRNLFGPGPLGELVLYTSSTDEPGTKKQKITNGRNTTTLLSSTPPQSSMPHNERIASVVNQTPSTVASSFSPQPQTGKQSTQMPRF